MRRLRSSVRGLALTLGVALAPGCGGPAPDEVEIDAGACNVLLLPPLTGDASSQAFGIGGERVVGVSFGGSNGTRPVEWQLLVPDEAEGWQCDDSQPRGDRRICVRELPPLDPAGPRGEAHDTDGKTIVGTAAGQPVVWRDDVPEAIAGGPGTAYALSSGGAVVGLRRSYQSTRPVNEIDFVPRGLLENPPHGGGELVALLGERHEPKIGPHGFLAAAGAAVRESLPTLHGVAEVRGALWAVGSCPRPPSIGGLPPDGPCHEGGGVLSGQGRRALVVNALGAPRFVLAGEEAFDLTPAPLFTPLPPPHGNDPAREVPGGADSDPFVPSEPAADGRVVVVGEASSSPALWDLPLPRGAGAYDPTPRLLGVGDADPAEGRAYAVVSTEPGLVVAGTYEKPGEGPRAFVWKERSGGSDLNDDVWPACNADLQEARDLDGHGRAVGIARASGRTRGFLFVEGTRPGYPRVEVEKLQPELPEGRSEAQPGDELELVFELKNPYDAELGFELHEVVPSGLSLLPSSLLPAAASGDACERGAWVASSGGEVWTDVRVPAGATCHVVLGVRVGRWGPEPIVNRVYWIEVGRDRVDGVAEVTVPVAIRAASAQKLVVSGATWRQRRFRYVLDPGSAPGEVTAYETLPDGLFAVTSARPPVPGAGALDCSGAHAWTHPDGEGADPDDDRTWEAPALRVGEGAVVCDLVVDVGAEPWAYGERRTYVNADYGIRVAGTPMPGPERTFTIARTQNGPPILSVLDGPPLCTALPSGEDVTFEVYTADPDGDAIVSLELREGNQVLATGEGGEIETLAAAFADGSHCVELVVTDAVGALTTVERCFGVGRTFGPEFDVAWLDPATGAAESRALALNESATVGGASDLDPCVWDASGVRTCPPQLAGAGYVTDLTESGSYVGYGGGDRSFFVRDGSVVCDEIAGGRLLALHDDGSFLAGLWMGGRRGFFLLDFIDLRFLVRFQAPPSATGCEIGDLGNNTAVVGTLGRGEPVIASFPTCDASGDPLREKFDLDESQVWGRVQSFDCTQRYGLLQSVSDLEPLEDFFEPRQITGDPVFGEEGETVMGYVRELGWTGGTPNWPDETVTEPLSPSGFRDPAGVPEALSEGGPIFLSRGAVASAVWDGNAERERVGYFDDQAGEHAFYLGDCGPQRLDDRVVDPACPGAFQLEQARAINEHGDVAGWGLCEGQRRAFRLDRR